MKQRKRDHCFLCGARDNLTSEHIPPDGFFLEPKPTNLITVPCCEACNNGHSKKDDLFRLVTSFAHNKNAAARLLWDKKVAPNTLAEGRQKHEVRALVRNATPVTLRTPNGDKVFPFISVPPEHILPSVIRITKGLLWTYHPEVDYKSTQFKVTQIHQYRVQEAVDCLGHTLHEERGDGVFHFWRGFLSESPRYGMYWLFVFFGSCAFLIEHPIEKARHIGCRHPQTMNLSNPPPH